MKNPLNKRFLRELKSDLGKYAVIFLFMIMLISLVSGFLVVSDSLIYTFDDNIYKLNVEDGHFGLNISADEELINELCEKGNVTIYDLSYFQEKLSDNASVRVYKNRTQVNITSLMSGRLPENVDEIAMDRLFARNNNISEGDEITLAGKRLKVVGMIALPDYSCLFENNSDMMLDSINFGVAVMSEEGFLAVDSARITNCYAWCYPEDIAWGDDVASKKKSDEFADVFASVIEDYDKKIIESRMDDIIFYGLCEMFERAQSEGEDLSGYDNVLGHALIAAKINEELNKADADTVSELFGSDDGADFSEIISELNIKVSSSDVKRAFRASEEERAKAGEVITAIENNTVVPKAFVGRYENKAINFGRSDTGGDSAMFLLFGYIVIIVLAFIFAVTVSNTIIAEAGVIGTLRASGYSRGELLVHYMTLPMLTVFVAALIGNILGYTVMTDMMKEIEYNSFSYAAFESRFNMQAFVYTTVIPVILMFIINVSILAVKLKLSPLRFLRHDLSKRGKKKAFRLNTKLPIMTRFRLRVLFQNIPNYLVLFFGIFVGGILVVFSLMFGPLLDEYAKISIASRLSDYQYVVAGDAVLSEDAEIYRAETLKTTDEKFMIDDIDIYGVVKGSKYVKAEIAQGKVLLSNGFSEKYSINVGDTVILKDPYSTKTYEFGVGGVYKYDAGLCVFMNMEDFEEYFGADKEDYKCVFTNTEQQIPEDDIYMVVTVDDLTKMTDQMKLSIGSFMDYMKYFGIIMFLLIMYILSKQIIEKNSKSISITKILGYTGGEIGKLYILATSIVVIVSLIITVPLTDMSLRAVFKTYLYTEMTGYMPYLISPGVYVETIIMGILSYAAVSILQMKKIEKIPKSDALKAVE